MNRMWSCAKICAVLVGACAASTAFADNPAGFYVGVGAGYSTIRSDDPSYGYPGYFDDHQAAWKVFAGVRPIPFLGAEIEYIDFGQPGQRRGYYDFNDYGTDSHPRAGSLSAIGYLPIPIPLLDIYAKAGVARISTNVPQIVDCSDPSSCPYVVHHDETSNKLTYGAGLQTKFWNVSFRAEYERISSSFGDPDAFTVGAAWNF